MKATMDSAGRLVIPVELRRRAGLQAGMPLELRWHDGRIEIEPAATPVQLERRGRFFVAVPSSDVDALTAEVVEETREALAGERSSDVLP